MEKIRAYELSKAFGIPSKEIVKVLHDYEAVSYTHLDVYKRQLCIVCLICLPISGLAFEIPGFGNGKETAVPQDDKSASLKMYSVQRSVTEKLQITPQNLTCDKGAFESAFLLYDKDENSFNRNENLTWMTLDAGEKQALIKIRYLVYANEALATSALGTKFLVSNNNRDFTDIATIEGNENGEITEGWHEIQLSGFGEYR